MKMRRGDMLDVIEQSHMFVISTNGILKRDGSLVMGGGIAKQIADRYPSIPAQAGELIKSGGFKRTRESNWKYSGTSYNYEFLQLPGTSICLLQVKSAWWDNAKLFLLYKSVLALRDSIDRFVVENKCDPVVHMNLPGVGLGGLSRNIVLNQIEPVLPDCVTVWEYENTEARVL